MSLLTIAIMNAVLTVAVVAPLAAVSRLPFLLDSEPSRTHVEFQPVVLAA